MANDEIRDGSCYCDSVNVGDWELTLVDSSYRVMPSNWEEAYNVKSFAS